MRGSIQKKGDRYYARIEVGRDAVTGRRRQKSLGGYRAKKEAQAAITKALGELQKGEFVESTRITFAEFLTDEWLPGVKSGLRESSWESYASNVRAHIIPRVGGHLLKNLQPAHLNALYAGLLKGGRKDGKGLSPRTVQLIHVTIHRALKDAVRWGRVARNVADQADPPKQTRREMNVWTASELRSFLRAVQHDRLYAAYLVAATTGMRRGELLGLRWRDVDLDAARIQVRQTYISVNNRPAFSTPKTPRSRRSIALDPATIAGLRDHRKRQLEERMAYGPGYDDSSDLVFVREDGTPIHPQSFSDAFERRVRNARLPTLHLHELRHTYATVALGAGVHPKVVSERLGHSSIAVTLDFYSHVIPALQEEAATQVASMILGGEA